MPYLFILGNTKELARAEIDAVFERNGLTVNCLSQSEKTLVLELDKTPSPQLLSTLGGAVKATQITSRLSPQSDLAQEIAQQLHAKAHSLDKEKFTFGLSIYGDSANAIRIPSLAAKIKEALQLSGYKTRFILPRPGEKELSSVVITKQNIFEIIISFSNPKEVIIGLTFWVQNFEDWNKRDYGRPCVAPHLGMLPPKVARMMVNLGFHTASQKPHQMTILDPFCGVGTILAEAMILGANVIGADINAGQVEKTKKNLDWLSKEYQLSNKNLQIMRIEAQMISTKLNTKVDAIVTEPYLGPNDSQIKNYSPEKIKNITSELVKLFSSCLADWHKVLAKGGNIVMVIPSFNISKDKEVHLVKMVVDKAKIMGYSVQTETFSYYRPQALVRRNICIFRKE